MLCISSGLKRRNTRKWREKTGAKKTVPTPTSIVYKNRCLPLFDSKTNCPLVNFHCECTFFSFWLFSVSGFSPVHIAFCYCSCFSSRCPSYIYEFTIIRYILFIVIITYCSCCLQKRMHASGGKSVSMCLCASGVFSAVPFLCCCCFDKQAKFRNSL